MNSPYKKIGPDDINFFAGIVGSEYVLADSHSLIQYGHDYTEDLEFQPELVLKPANANEISRILRYCNENIIPVTARGAGTGLSGGALPVFGGIILSTERMNKILEIDEINFQATVEPGVINEVFQQAVSAKGLFYPPDPASKGSCFIGGNVAHSAGGPRALKYGTTKDYVLNLELVLPNGEIIMTGANTLKYSTGYHLSQLVVGSEGTLGIVTKIIVRLIPLPKHNILLLAPFDSARNACAAVAEVFRAGITPSALEFVDRNAMKYAIDFSRISFEIPDGIEAYLLIEVDGNYMDMLYSDADLINSVLEKFGCSNVSFAESSDEKERIWAIRRKAGEAVKAVSIYKEEDTVVPRGKLPELISEVYSIAEKYRFKVACYGHAGDGNLHVNILKSGLDNETWNNSIKLAIREIFTVCKNLGGTISGEHGIGLVQKEFMDIMFTESHLDLMRKIKKAFDPNWILNPGKIF